MSLSSGLDELQTQVQYRLIEELKARVRQQAVISELGQKALSCKDVGELLDESVRLAAEMLEVEFTNILELMPEGRFLLRCGLGWKKGLIGELTLEAGTDVLAGYTVGSKGPVIIEDVQKEQRFRVAPFVLEHGIRSAVTVVMGRKDRPFGILGAYSGRERSFSWDDVNFIQAIANIIATAIERHRWEERLIRLNRMLLNFGLDCGRNIRLLVESSLELLGACRVRYDRFSTGPFCTAGDFAADLDSFDLHAFREEIDKRSGKDDITVLRKEPDYVLAGRPVFCYGSPVGALSAFFSKKADFTANDETVFAIISSALGMEEERLMAEREKDKLYEQLLQSNKLEAIGRLAGGIAHDFNNLLTGVLGNASLAKALVKEDAKILRVMDSLENASLRAKDLTHQLLTFAKGGAPLKKTASVAELIKESASFVVRGSDTMCKFEIAPDLLPLEVDEGQISQVIQNLIINAGQAMPKGGVVTVKAENLRAGIEQEPPQLKDRRYVRITISDTGVGIPEENLLKIFDPYFTTKKEGSGLGLFSVYSIVKNHDGLVKVESIPGAGTSFHIYLPATDNRLEPVPADKEKIVHGKGRVLVMDDEEIVRDVAGEILSLLGYEVHLTTDGHEAVQAYERAKEEGRPFDVVIMDLTVPGGMGGKETIRRLSELDPKVKAIVSSGYSEESIMAESGIYGFRAAIAKPYKISELSRTVFNVINGAA